jgi:hypothetical protein
MLLHMEGFTNTKQSDRPAYRPTLPTRIGLEQDAALSQHPPHRCPSQEPPLLRHINLQMRFHAPLISLLITIGELPLGEVL